jgi:tetratricopeptide (TPR) repeat protein
MLQSKDKLVATVGPQHPDVATVAHNLAVLQQHFGRFEEAISNFENAAAIYERAFGPQHLRTGSTLADLATALALGGHHSRAAERMRRAIDIISRFPESQRFGVRSYDELVYDLRLMLAQDGRSRFEVSVATAALSPKNSLDTWRWWKLRAHALVLRGLAFFRKT